MNKLLLTASLAVVAAASASAVTVYGLSTFDQLIRFDSSDPTNVQQASFISGLAANENLVGIDFRPSNGSLYAIGSFGNIYTLNTTTAAATYVSTIGVALSGSHFGVDFNPVADRLRVTSNLDQNLRINVDTGATIIDGTLNQAVGSPYVVASAYTNSVPMPMSTVLYNLDSFSDTLNTQIPANNGTQQQIGSLGADITALAGLDILTVGQSNTAYAAVQFMGGQSSHFATIDLNTGAHTLLGTIGDAQTGDVLAIESIAVTPVPEPATMVALGLGLAALARRRRNK